MDIWKETICYKFFVGLEECLASVDVSFVDAAVFLLDTLFVIAVVFFIGFVFVAVIEFVTWVLEFFEII